jgi:hypothetical protein
MTVENGEFKGSTREFLKAESSGELFDDLYKHAAEKLVILKRANDADMPPAKKFFIMAPAFDELCRIEKSLNTVRKSKMQQGKTLEISRLMDGYQITLADLKDRIDASQEKNNV